MLAYVQSICQLLDQTLKIRKMKIINIYITGAFLLFALHSLVAQDVSLTNANMVKPGKGQEYGQACFTMIAEEGVMVTDIPLVIEISMSKVDFDPQNITGFNSNYFNWNVDEFANNVIRGTLIDDIPDVDNGGGGAQICIPVKRSKHTKYNDVRNGYVVNIVPGSLDQGGNSGSDYTSRFGFSPPSNSVVSNKEDQLVAKRNSKSKSIETFDVTVFPNPTIDVVNINATLVGNDYSLNVYDMTGRPKVMGRSFDGNESIAVQDWTTGMYIMEIQNNENGDKSITRLMVTK